MSAPAFRKDIEGLRAIAVLPVVAFHAGWSIVPGGFVGVDVFFVISGYLITELLYRAIRTGSFSLSEFYQRRIRRILPGLLAMLAVTFALGLRFCMPDELVDLSKSLVAAALSASNFYFWSSTGYFGGDAAAKPLLHTWSLAVEEQFYLVWPLWLALGWRYFRSRLAAVTALIALGSLILSSVGAFRFPAATFYMPWTRLWELAAGGLLALGWGPRDLRPAARNLLCAAGLVLILASVFTIDSSMPFPGLLALPPCLGAMLVIAAGRSGDSFAARMISLRPLTSIGAISYSLYLWHWPVVVFQQQYAFLADGLSQRDTKLLIMAVSIAVAAGSWRCIEQPFRAGRMRLPGRRLVAGAALGAFAVAACGLVAWIAGGFPGRYSRSQLETISRLMVIDHAAWRSDRCFLYDGRKDWHFSPECLTTVSDKKNYLLLGDSHAAELWSGLSSTFRDTNFLQASAANCYPTIVHDGSESDRCIAVIDGAMRSLLAGRSVDRVLLAAKWKSSGLDNVAATLDWLRSNGVKVTLLGPTVLYDSPIPRLVVTAMEASDPSVLQRHIRDSVLPLDEQMAKLASAHGADYISLRALQCADPACAMGADAHWPEMFDEEHFNVEGLKIIAAKIKTAYTDFGS